MLSEAEGNLFDAQVDALVNTVNTVGVMGKGIALQFKQAYPDNFRAYEAACRHGEVQLGRMFVVETGLLSQPRLIINFPTKKHWRTRSKLGDIETGLADLRRVIGEYKITSIAVPPLGCGNGGLAWRDVQPMIVEALGDLPGVDVVVYPPKGAPPAHSMKVGTARPPMTPGRAALLTLLARYIRVSQLEEPAAPDGASLLEIQKLLYFLQEAGQHLSLNFSKGAYGPYAENLNHALQAMEGHYPRGYGDRTQEVLRLCPISVTTNAEDKGRQWLGTHPDGSSRRIEAVLQLITGFASAYGLELLATVHWVLTHDHDDLTTDSDALVQRVRSWSTRKGRLFTETHIRRAAHQLRKQGWLSPTRPVPRT
jgi:O-acetyl-ADP-ribose deacetylase (regulator of RNase III)